MTQREDWRVGDPREACEGLVSVFSSNLFGSDDPVPVVCEYPVCPRDEKDHRGLYCSEPCPNRVYVPEHQVELEHSE